MARRAVAASTVLWLGGDGREHCGAQPAGGGSATDSASTVTSSTIAAYSRRRLRIGRQDAIQLGSLLGRQRPGRAQRQQLVSLLGHHVVSITWRNLIKPSRTRVFAVPKAMPRRSAISTWVNPPK